MTREEHLVFCKACKNQDFDPNKGVICKLTSQIADFEGQCESYLEDVTKINNNRNELNSIKDNSGRARAVILVFWGICFISVLAALSGYLEYELLTRANETGEYTEQEVTINDLRQGIIGLIQSGLTIAAIVLFLNWFRRAYSNLHRVGIQHIEYQDSMALWSFAIPIVNLFRPYKIAKEIAIETRKMISDLNIHYKVSDNDTIIAIWWGLFIIAGIIGRIALKTMFKDDTIEQVITSTQVFIFSDIFDVLAAFATLMMIKHISKSESALFRGISELQSQINIEKRRKATISLMHGYE